MRRTRILPRSACFVEILLLPRLKEREIADLVSEHAGTEVPIPIDEAETDFVVRRRPGGVFVLAVVAPRGPLESVHDPDRERLILSTELLMRAARGSEIAVFLGDGWGEALRPGGEGITSDGFRWATREELQQRLGELVGRGTGEGGDASELPIVVVSEIRQPPEAIAGRPVEVIAAAEALRRHGNRCQPLFEAYREKQAGRSRSRSLIPAALLLAFLAFLGHRDLELKRSELSSLQAIVESTRAATAEAEQLVQEIAVLEEALNQARRSGLWLPGTALGPIVGAMPGGVQLQSLILDASGGTIQGSSNLPFEILERLQELPMIADAQLLSLERVEGEGLFRFSLRFLFTDSSGGGRL